MLVVAVAVIVAAVVAVAVVVAVFVVAVVVFYFGYVLRLKLRAWYANAWCSDGDCQSLSVK